MNAIINIGRRVSRGEESQAKANIMGGEGGQSITNE